MQVLAINPGSTSTKIALFANETCLWKQVIEHPEKEISSFKKIGDQYQYRLKAIMHTLQAKACDLEKLNAIVGRGGLLKPLPGGTYLIDQSLVEESYYAPGGEHAANLGAILAYYLAIPHNVPAFIVNPVTVDEMDPLARFSGHPELPRSSQSHALNIKAVAHKVAKTLGKAYGDTNLVVVHLGSGISVTAHRKGKMIDVNNANNEGPFSAERCGSLPSAKLIKLCFSGKYTEEQMLTLLLKQGGLYAYLGTKNVRKVIKYATQGDEQAELILKAMCYQIAKEIGAMSTTLAGDVDRIILTGGMAQAKFITEEIIRRVSFIAPVVVLPGEEEMEALALGALRVLRQEEPALRY